MKYCKAIIPINSNEEFIYIIPEQMKDVKIGSIVITKFRNKSVYALITGFVKETEIKNIKSIETLHLDNPVNKDYIKLIEWIADYYFTSKGNVLRNFLPSIKKNVKRYIYNKGENEILLKIKELSKNKPLSQTEIKKIIKKNYDLYKLIREKFIIEDIDNYVKGDRKNIVLNEEQEKAYRTIKKSLIKNEHHTYLLYGVPASGKSEVYMKLIEHIIDNTNKNVLLLLPEIGLAQYVYKIIKERFGTKNIAIIHSELSAGEKYFYVNAINNNTKRIIIGTRSAIFAPIKNLGIVIIDEEQDMSYKQDATPFYNGRDVGIYIAYKNNIPVVLCSATPSLETYYNVKTKKYTELKLLKSYTNVKKPNVKIHYSDYKNILPVYIMDSISDTIKKGGQIIIFLNRRGYLNLYKCSNCGAYFKCDNCSVSYSFHKNENKFVCHYCGAKKSHDSVCNICEGTLISSGVYGTEKVESILKKLYPELNIIRMDLDTAMHKGKRKNIIETMINNNADILIGTQMISKGYDIPNVNTVIILNADSVMNIPDIRSEERFMQLLIQTSGRAGRRDKRGEIILEAGTGIKGFENFISELDFKGFIERELKKRKELNFPPYSRMMKIIVKDKNRDNAVKRINEIYQILNKKQNKYNEQFTVYSPVPALIEKINKTYRFNIFIVYNNFLVIKKIINRIYEIRKDFLIDNDP